MSYAINTYLPDFEISQDIAKRNSGGLRQPDTLIEQGDYPVNVVDLENYDRMDIEMRSEYPELYEGDSDYVQPMRCGGDVDEGVSFCKPMLKETIRKNSDY